MMIPLSIAKNLVLLAEGAQLPASGLKHAVIDELIREGIIVARMAGRTKSTLHIPDVTALSNYLYNTWSIADLQLYVQTLENADATRGDLIAAGNDSKAAMRRTFKGFLVNSYKPIACMLNGTPIVIEPPKGTFQFISDFEHFIPPDDVVIIGVENAENFRLAEKQRHLFADIDVLFVSRYPQQQSSDLMKWLLALPNRYLHFGDYDLAGINIYLQEYKRHLNDRASFFIPGNIEELIEKHGNRKLYDRQQLNDTPIAEDSLRRLVSLIHKHKKGLEQEALLI